MTPQRKDKKSTSKSNVTLRYFDDEHRQLVLNAAARAKVSINAWIVSVTLAQARRELGL
jgi:predicted HicB family RNase H-like nuclease